MAASTETKNSKYWADMFHQMKSHIRLRYLSAGVLRNFPENILTVKL